MIPSLPSSRLLPLAVAALLAVACGGTSDDHSAPAPAADPPASQPAPSATPSEDTGGPDLAPISSRSQPDGSRIVAAGASFVFPEDWEREQPSSSMRLAQARLPGDAGAAELTLFHFGVGGGGGVESNLSRWLGQVQLDEGTSPVRDQFQVDPFTVHWMEAAGTLMPSNMGTGPDSPQPGSRLLGAVVEGPGGPWFFKITGPSATVEAHRNAFIDMLKTAQVAS